MPNSLSIASTGRRRSVGAVLLAALLVLLSPLLAGCESQTKPIGVAVPDDFALVIVVTPKVSTRHPLLRPRRLTLTIDRQLRMARGDAAPWVTHPPVARRLGPIQLESIWNQIRARHLMSEPTSPYAMALRQSSAPAGATALKATLYEVTIRAWGRTHRYATTPSESPPTANLLRQLITYADGEAPPPLQTR
ncbi:MAG: hypothetical protein R3336_02510 [Phycisphaeraceae bacterium]|nr:hypothetical protein [Phycisphaeraceae bacterium]